MNDEPTEPGPSWPAAADDPVSADDIDQAFTEMYSAVEHEHSALKKYPWKLYATVFVIAAAAPAAALYVFFR